MTVIIGVDPHKASYTAVAVGCDEQQLAEIKVRAACQQTRSNWPGRNLWVSAPGASSRPAG